MTQKIVEAFEQLLAVERKNINRKIVKDISGVVSTAASAGMLNSSMTMLNIVEAASHSLPVFADAALLLAKRASAEGCSPINEDNVEEWKSRVCTALDGYTHSLRETILDHPPFKGGSLGDPDRFLEELGQISSEQKARAEADLNLTSINGTEKSAQGRAPHHTNISINGSVGIVQSGNSNVGSVTQHIDQGTIAELKSALCEISEKLSEDHSAYGELREIVDEAQSELGEDTPNKTKIRSLVSGIGSTIHQIPKFEKAYDALARAAEGIGGFFAG
ncbi:hypothetical protein [Roseovarius pacificus]|uniref:hypothetical protein n=1 Tax=Roseovarius pacificus TaxID=337701 RepID=UPI00403A0B70